MIVLMRIISIINIKEDDYDMDRYANNNWKTFERI